MTAKERRFLIRSTADTIWDGRLRWEASEHVFAVAKSMGLTLTEDEAESIAAAAWGET